MSEGKEVLEMFFTDKDGNEIKSQEVIEKLFETISAQLDDEESPITSTIVPLSKVISILSIDKAAGVAMTEMVKNVDTFKSLWNGVILSTITSFMLYAAMNQHGYTIGKRKIALSDEQLERDSKIAESLHEKLLEYGIRLTGSEDNSEN